MDTNEVLARLAKSIEHWDDARDVEVVGSELLVEVGGRRLAVIIEAV